MTQGETVLKTDGMYQRALAIYDDRGYTTGHLVKCEGGAVCLMGAIALAAGYPEEILRDNEESNQVYDNVGLFRGVRKVIYDLFDYGTDPVDDPKLTEEEIEGGYADNYSSFVYGFNDTYGPDDVRLVLADAARREREGLL